MVLLLASCGQRHTAMKLAEDFIEQNATSPDNIQQRNFGKLGQTNKLNDSVVAQLQTQATDFLKPGISYPAYQQGDTLFFIRMSYVCNNETLSHTFYADKQLEHIVAVK
jgi:hypothetical protein